MRKRWVQINGELVEVDQNYKPEPRAQFYVMPDIKPYKSMIDGSMINSRSTHRTHLRDHGCIEVGNEMPKPKSSTLTSPPGLKETIIREVYKRR